MTYQPHHHAGHLARNGAARRAGVAICAASWSTAGLSNDMAIFAGYAAVAATKLRSLRPPEPSP